MKRIELETQFTATERAVIKRFLTLINDAATENTDFAKPSDIESLNQFSDLAETDSDIEKGVLEWIAIRKKRGHYRQDN